MLDQDENSVFEIDTSGHQHDTYRYVGNGVSLSLSECFELYRNFETLPLSQKGWLLCCNLSKKKIKKEKQAKSKKNPKTQLFPSNYFKTHLIDKCNNKIAINSD